MTDDVVLARLAQLENAVRKAGESLARLREDNARLTGEVKQLHEERRQVLAQVDTLLRDIGKLDLE